MNHLTFVHSVMALAGQPLEKQAEPEGKIIEAIDALKSQKKSRITKSRTGPMALEQRFMFDGAAVMDAVDGASKVINTTSGDAGATVVDKTVHLELLSPANVQLSQSVMTAKADAEKLVADFLARPDAKHELFALFNGGKSSPDAQWLAAYDQWMKDIQSGSNHLQVELRTASDLKGAYGAFARQGVDGKSIIYLNADWIASGANPGQITSVLVEEMGHSIDASLNGSLDTVGDEGAIFAQVAQATATTDAVIVQATDDDNGHLNIDGVDTSVEFSWALPTPFDSGWKTLGRYGDINKPIDGWNTSANAPDLVGTAGSPYLQYKYGQIGGVDVVYFKVRAEEIGTATTYMTPGIQTFLDLNLDGKPEFTMGFIVNSQSNAFNASTGAMPTITSGREVWFQALDAQYTATNPSATVVAGLNSNGAYKVMSDAAGGSYKVAPAGLTLQVYRDLSASVSGSDLDGDGNVRENYYILSVPLAEYTAFVTQVNAANTSSPGTWISPAASWTTNTSFQGGSLSTTSGLASYTGDLGSGSYNMGTMTSWKAIWGMNDAPIAVGNTYTAIEDTLLAAQNIITNDNNGSTAGGVDYDAITPTTSLTISKINGVTFTANGVQAGHLAANGWMQLSLTNGTLFIKQDGTMEYLPALNSSAGDSFTYTINDDGIDGGDIKESNTATVTLNVTAVNDSPAANADTVTATENGGAEVNPADGGSGGFDAAGNVITGTVTSSQGGTGAADSDAEGGVTLTRIANTAKGNSATIDTTVNLSSTSSPVTLAGLYGTLKVGKDGSYIYEVDNLNAAVQALRLTTNTLTETYTYTITDTGGLKTSSTLTITIKGSNDYPIAVSDFNTARESQLASGSAYVAGTDTLGYKATGNVLINDTDVDAPGNGETKQLTDTQFTASFSTSSVSNATISVTQLGTNLSSLSNRVPLRIYILQDVDGSVSTTGDQTWIDTGVNATNITTGNPNSITVDKPGQLIYYKNLYSNLTNLVYSGVNYSNKISLGNTANGDFGTISSSSGDTAISNVTLSSSSAVLSNGMIATWNTGTGTSSAAISNVVYTGPTLTSFDVVGTIVPDGVTLSFSQQVSSTLNGKYGTLTWTSTGGLYLGEYTYTPYRQDQNGGNLTDGQSYDEVFAYTMKDASNVQSVSTLTIRVYGSGSADPTAVADTANAYELGGYDPSSVGGISETTYTGTLSKDAATGLLSNDTDPQGSGQLTITQVRSDTAKSVSTDVKSTTSLNATTASSSTAVIGQYGSLKVAADGSYIYDIDDLNAAVQALRAGTSASSLSEVFTYLVRDIELHYTSSTLTITINGRNDAPQAVDDSDTAIEPGVNGSTTVTGSGASGNVVNNDVDVDGTTKTVTEVWAGLTDDATSATSLTGSINQTAGVGSRVYGSYGYLNLTSNGNYTYTLYSASDANLVADKGDALAKTLADTTNALTAGQAVTDTFMYTVADANTGDSYQLSDTAVLTINITGTNDAPVAKANGYTVNEDNSLGSSNILTDNDSSSGLDNDPEGDTLTVAAINGVAFTSLTAASDRNGLSGWKQVTLTDGVLYLRDNGSIEFVPNPGFNGTQTFTYTTVDSNGSPSNAATVTITVNPVNDTPTISVTALASTVQEAAMSNGADPSSDGEFSSGYITVADPDGLSDIKSISFETSTGTVIKTLTVGAATAATNEETVANLASMVGKSFNTTNGTVTLISFDASSGKFAYSFELTSASTDVAGAAETNIFVARVVDSATAAATATVTIEIIDDVPNAMQNSTAVTASQTTPIALVIDETSGTQAGADATTPGTTTASFATLFDTDANTAGVQTTYGADGPGSVAYTLSLVNASNGATVTGLGSGLFSLDATDVETTIDPLGKGDEILLKMGAGGDTGAVIGYVNVSGSDVEYFRISVSNTGTVTFTQASGKNIWHATTSNNDDTATLVLSQLGGGADAALRLTQTVTDADGDSDSDFVDLVSSATSTDVATFSIKDDGPNAANATPGTAVTITLDETSAKVSGIRSATGAFASHFSSAASVYGSDGAGAIAYSLSLTGSNVASGLYALDTADTVTTDSDGIGQGSQIVLNQVGNDIVGTVGTTEYIRLSVNASTGVVTFSQTNNIWHSNTANADEAAALSVTASALKLVQTVTDADGDTSTASYDLGTGSRLSILDDGPTAANATPGTPVTITLDESSLSSDTKSFAGYFSSSSIYGSDGAGSVRYALKLNTEGVDSGLYKLDNSDGSGADGDGIGQGSAIQLFTNHVTGDIEGRLGSSTGTHYFTLSVNNSGAVTFSQLINVWHPYSSDLPSNVSLTTSSGNLELVQTVVDADGDSSAISKDLGASSFSIQAHPAAITVTGGTYNEASPRAIFTVTANNGQLLTLDVKDVADTGKNPTGSNAGTGDDLDNADIYYSIDSGATWVKYTGAAFAAGTQPVLVAVDITKEADTPYEGEEQLQLLVNTGLSTEKSAFSSIKDDGTGIITQAITAATTNNSGANDSSVVKDDDRPITVTGGTYNEASPRAIFTVTANNGQLLTLDVKDVADTGKNPTGSNAGTGDDLDNADIYYSIDSGATWVKYTGAAFAAGTQPVLVAVDITKEADTPYEGEEQLQLLVNTGLSTEKSAFSSIKDDGTGIITQAITAATTNNSGANDSSVVKDDDRPITVTGGTYNEASPRAVFTVTANNGQLLTLDVKDVADTGKNPTGSNAGTGDDLDNADIYYSIDSGATWVKYTGAAFAAGTQPVLVAVDITKEADTPYEGEEQLQLLVNTGLSTEKSAFSSIKDDGTGIITQAITAATTNNSGANDSSVVKDDDRPITVTGGTYNEASPRAIFTVTANNGQLLTLDVKDVADTGKNPTGSNAGTGDDLDNADIYYSIDSGATWVKYTGAAFAAGTQPVLVAVDITKEADTPYEGEEQLQLLVNTGLSTEKSAFSSIKDDGTGIITQAITAATTNNSGANDSSVVKDDDRPITVTGGTYNEASPRAIFTVTANNGQLLTLDVKDVADTGKNPTGSNAGTGDDLDNADIYYSIDSGATWVKYTGAAFAAGTQPVLVAVDITKEADTPYEGEEQLQLLVNTGLSTEKSAFSSIKDDGTGIITQAITAATTNNSGANDSSVVKDDDRPITVTGGTYNEASPRAIFTVTANNGQLLTLDVKDVADTGKNPTGSNAGTGDDLDNADIYYSIDSGATWVKYTGAAFAAGTQPVLVAVDITKEADTPYEGEEQLQLLVNTGLSTEKSAFSSIKDDGTGIITQAITAATTNNSGANDSSVVKDDDRPITVTGGTYNEASPRAIFTVTANNGQLLTLDVKDVADTGKNPTGSNAGTGDDLDNADIYYSIDSGATWVKYTGAAFAAGTQPVLVAVDITKEADTPYEGEEQLQLLVNTGLSTEKSAFSSIKDDGTGIITQAITAATTNNSGANDSSVVKDDDRPITVTGGTYNEASPRAIFTVTANNGQLLTLDVKDVADTGKNPTGSNAGTGDDLDNADIYYSIDSGATWVKYTGAAFAAGTQPVLVAVDITKEADTPYEGEEQLQLLVNTGLSTEKSAFSSIKDDGTGIITQAITAATTNNSGANDSSVVKDDDRPIGVTSYGPVNEGSKYAMFKIDGTPGYPMDLTLQAATAGKAATTIGFTLEFSIDGGITWTPYSASSKPTVPPDGSFFVRANIISEADSDFEGSETFALKASYSNNPGKSAAADATIVDDGTGAKYDGTLASGPAPASNTDQLDDDQPKPIIRPNPPAPQPPVNVKPPEPPAAPPPALPKPFNSAVQVLEQKLAPPSALPTTTIGEVLTSNSGFPIVAIENAPPGLTLNRGITDQYVEPGTAAGKVSVPYDAFMHSKQDAVVKLQAKQGDDAPLPPWVKFDPQAGSFDVTPPPGFKGKVELKVIARDEEGREATSIFRLFVGEEAPAPQKPQSRNSLSEKIRLAAKRPALPLPVTLSPVMTIERPLTVSETAHAG